MPTNVISPDGEALSVPDEQVAALQDLGYTVETASEAVTRGREAELEAAYGDSAILAGAQGAARGLTLGLSDLAATELGLASDEALRETRERNRGASLTGEIVGGLAPGLVSGGTGTAANLARMTPAGASSRLGTALASRGTVGGALLGGATEGAIAGAGQGISELALSEDPVTLERAASVLSSNALMGGALGGGAGVFAKAAEKGLVRAKGLVDEGVEALRTRAGAGVPDDLARLDAKGLREARETELARLADEQKAARSTAADELAAYRSEFKASNPYLTTDDATTRKLLVQQERTFRRLLDEPIGLAENPRKALDPLRREAQALRRSLADREAMAAKLAQQDAEMAGELAEELATLPDTAAKVSLSGKTARKFGDWADVKVPSKKGVVQVTREQAAEFQEALASGSIQGQRAQALEQLQGVLRRNEELQAKIAASFESPKSPRLEAIDEAKDALGKGRSTAETAALGYAATAVTGVLPGGPIGALAAIAAPKALAKLADLVTGRLAKAVAEQGARSSTAIDTLLSASGKVARAVPRVASRTLASVSYGGERNATAAKGDLVASYREREREIRDVTLPGPDGRPQMRPAAREQVAERLSGVRAVSPLLADTIETVQARRVAFLASKLPLRPDFGTLQIGPDSWTPSEFAIRQWARYVDAVEDPAGIEERLAAGTLTTEDAEVMREVYPERFEAMKAEIIARLPEVRGALPYERRLAMSIFFGVPVDPALTPGLVALLQGNYTVEPGTEGGTTAPAPQPQFGSIQKSAPSPTPAQERAG